MRSCRARSIAGLAKIELASPNTLVAFAAKAGSTAADGNAKNSPFTAALVKYLPTPGLDLRKAFGFVRDDVLKMTRNKQEPFIYGSLGGEDVPLVPAPPVAAAPIVDPGTAARDDYELASQINVVSAWDSFLRKYPTGFYSDLARAQREKLMAARAAAVEQAGSLTRARPSTMQRRPKRNVRGSRLKPRPPKTRGSPPRRRVPRKKRGRRRRARPRSKRPSPQPRPPRTRA